LCIEYVCNDATGECDEVFTDNRCDDESACTTVDFCQEGECIGTQVAACEPRTCQVGTCVGDECIYENEDRGTRCDDGNSCTLNDVCDGNGSCAGTPLNCYDGNVCTDNVCVDGECQSTDNSNECNDGDDCTVGDQCTGGVCVGQAVECEDEVCFDVECRNGECVRTPNNDSCDDGNDCTEGDVCRGGVCEGELIECGPEDDSDINHVCFDYFCDVELGRCTQILNAASCDDGDACTADSACVAGVCEGFSTTQCVSDSPCLESICNRETGECEESPIDNTCSDNNRCTENDICDNGTCVGEPIPNCCDSEDCPECFVDTDCDSASNCVIGTCNEAGECEYEDVSCPEASLCIEYVCNDATGECDEVFTDNRCDDESACTTVDFCQEGECIGTQVAACEPRTCQVGTCVGDECIYENEDRGTRCDDGNSCTLNDVCDGNGSCAGTPLNCYDGNVCTDNVCVDGECQSTDNSNECNDGDDCTVGDQCTGGVCVGQAVECEDEVCFDVECRNGECVRTPNNDSCDDGNDCTENDVCTRGVCSGREIVCESENECVTSECVGGVCVETNLDIECNDNDPCTLNDICTEGVCSGVARDCSPLDTECSRGACFNGFCVRASFDTFEGRGCGPEATSSSTSESEDPNNDNNNDNDNDNEDEGGVRRRGECVSGVCVIPVSGSNGDNGVIVDNNQGGNTGNIDGNLNNPPTTNGNNGGGNAPDSNFPGTTQNPVLTGTYGTVGSLVLGGVGASSVLMLGLLAAAFGLNSTKEDPAQNLTAVLAENEMSTIGAINPIFEGGEGVHVVGI